MVRWWWAYLMLGLLAPLAWAAPQSAEPELAFVVPWGPAGLTLDRGGQERPVRGPGAVALGDGGRVHLLDSLAQRVVSFDASGKRLAQVAFAGGLADDLAVGDDRFLLLRTHVGHVDVIDGQGKQVEQLALPRAVGPVERLFWSEQAGVGLWGIHGERFQLGRPESPRPLRAVLLDRQQGPPESVFDCGVRVDDQGRVELLRRRQAQGLQRQRSREEAKLLDVGPVAAARVVSACRDRGTLIELERLVHPERTRVEVRREVALVVCGRVTSSWQVPAGWLYQPRGRFAQRGDQLLMMLPVEAGLQLWRWRLP